MQWQLVSLCLSYHFINSQNTTYRGGGRNQRGSLVSFVSSPGQELLLYRLVPTEGILGLRTHVRDAGQTWPCCPELPLGGDRQVAGGAENRLPWWMIRRQHAARCSQDNTRGLVWKRALSDDIWAERSEGRSREEARTGGRCRGRPPWPSERRKAGALGRG